MIEYLQKCLDDETRTLDYDELLSAIHEHEKLPADATFDPFVKAAYYYTSLNLTKAQALRVATLFRELALSVFLFNLHEADIHSNELLEAVNAI